MNERTKNAALSGAASGAVLGGAGSILTGANLKSALRAALLGSVASAGMAGGGMAIGNSILGDPPDEDEINPNTRRTALGGGIAGGSIGALLGGALGKKYLRLPGATGLTKYIASKSPKTAALLGGGSGALAGSYLAADEGMQLDFLQNELDALERKRRAKELGIYE